MCCVLKLEEKLQIAKRNNCLPKIVIPYILLAKVAK